MKTTEKKVLVALNDSMSSEAVIDFIINLPLSHEKLHICLLHIFRKSSASEELMGRKFTAEQPDKMTAMLEKAKEHLIKNGFLPNKVDIEIAQDEYPNVADGIIDQHKKQKYNMVIIGRKKMSKAEEFVMGDISIKLIRMLEDAAILVVKP